MITGYPGVSSVPLKRFLFFKNPITLQNLEDIDTAFYTACIINNLILKHDSLDKLWLDDASWENTLKDGDIIVPEHEVLDI